MTSRRSTPRDARRPAQRRASRCPGPHATDPFDRERKFARLDLKAAEENGVFSGYASIFGKADLGGDRVEPGAFADSLAARGVAGIKMLFQHDPAEPIGVWRDIREDATGLHVTGQLMPDVARAREVLSLMRAGALDGLSIGFRTVKGRTDARTGIRHLARIDLWEISIVTFPMLPDARVEQVKRSPWRVAGDTERSTAAAIRRAAAAMR